MPTETPPPADFAVDQRLWTRLRSIARSTTDRAPASGREPNHVELGMFGAMWSEHCGYKNSRPLLKLFPTSGAARAAKAGEENAGAVDIGDGLAVVFKIESHNHPSADRAVPGRGDRRRRHRPRHLHHGRASHRPARLAALRPARRAAQRATCFAGIVGGIGGYGNCLGIPTVGGEIYFDASYTGNPLVNAMCVGLVAARAS